MRDIETGQALEEMLETDGWKYVDQWMQTQEKQATKDLTSKRFTDLGEVKALQVKIQTFRELRGEIDHRIRKGKDARRKQE